MANNDISNSLRQLGNQLRAYKSAQARLASTVQTFETTATFNVPVSDVIHIWAEGANPNSFIANIFISSPNATGNNQTIADVLSTFTDDGRIGWQVSTHIAGSGTFPINVKVQSNQEVSLDYE